MSLATALVYQGKDYSASIQPSLRYVRQTGLLQEADTGVTARVTKMLGSNWNITGSVFYTDRRIEQDRSRDARAVGATFGATGYLTPNLKGGTASTFPPDPANHTPHPPQQ